jgi:hypothetical protein
MMRARFKHRTGFTRLLAKLALFVPTSLAKPDIAAAGRHCNKPHREMSDDRMIPGP